MDVITAVNQPNIVNKSLPTNNEDIKETTENTKVNM